MATDIIKSFVFKNGLALDFDEKKLERGIVYFIRTSEDKAEGYVYFNNKRYGSVAEVRKEIEAVSKKLPLSAGTYDAAVALAADGNLGQIIYVTNDSYKYVEIASLPEGVEGSSVEAVNPLPENPTADSAEYVKVFDGSTAYTFYRLNEYQSGAYVVNGVNSIAPLSTSLPGGEDVSSAVAALKGEVNTLKTEVTDIKSTVETQGEGLKELSGSVITLSGSVETISGDVDTLKTEVSDIKTEIGTSADTTSDTLWGAINSVADNVALEVSTEETRAAGHISILRNGNKELYGVMYYLDDDDETASAGEVTGGTETQA